MKKTLYELIMLARSGEPFEAVNPVTGNKFYGKEFVSENKWTANEITKLWDFRSTREPRIFYVNEYFDGDKCILASWFGSEAMANWHAMPDRIACRKFIEVIDEEKGDQG